MAAVVSGVAASRKYAYVMHSFETWDTSVGIGADGVVWNYLDICLRQAAEGGVETGRAKHVRVAR